MLTTRLLASRATQIRSGRRERNANENEILVSENAFLGASLQGPSAKNFEGGPAFFSEDRKSRHNLLNPSCRGDRTHLHQ